MSRPNLPRYARRSEFYTQRVLCVYGVDTVAELVERLKGTGKNYYGWNQMFRIRGIGKKWISEFARENGLLENLTEWEYNFLSPCKRTNHNTPETRAEWSGYMI